MQVVGQIMGGGITPRRVFFEAFQADCLEVVRNPRLQLTRGHRLLIQHLADGVDRIACGRGASLPVARRGSRQGIDVGGGTDLVVLASCLLGRHVAGGAQDRAAVRVWLESSSTCFARPKSAILGTVARDQWSLGSDWDSMSRLLKDEESLLLLSLASRILAGFKSR